MDLGINCRLQTGGTLAHTRGLRCAPIVLLLAMTLAAWAAPVINTTQSTIRFLEERLQRDPDDFIAAAKLGDTYLQSARETGAMDNYAKAERVLRSALQWESNSYPMRVSLASTLVSQHKFREAADLVAPLTSERTNDAPAFGVLGDALLELGDVGKASAAYHRFIQLAPGVSSHSRMAKLHWLIGDVPAALSNLTAAIEWGGAASPETIAWLRVYKGELLFRTGEFEKAEREYKAALNAFPNYFVALDHIAELRAAEKKFDEAVKIFQQLAERTRRPEYLQAVGDVHDAARKRDEAKPWHDRALAAYLKETSAGNVHYFHHLATFYSDVREDGVEAAKWARRDLEVRQNIYAWDALAWALYRQEDFTGAFDAMKKALVLGTKDAHLLSHAGMIFVVAGKFSDGREYMKRASEVNPRYQSFHVHR